MHFFVKCMLFIFISGVGYPEPWGKY